MKYILLIACMLCCVPAGYAQQDTTEQAEKIPAKKHSGRHGVYKIHYGYTVPVVVAGGSWCMYAFSKIYSKTATPVPKVLALDKQNVPVFDRWVAGKHSDKIDKISYYPFYAAMPLPLVLLADRHINKNAGTVGLLYLEAFAYTGVLYTGSVYFIDRYRPDVYNTSLPLDYRTNGNFRNSFFAGHVALLATSSLFVSKVFADYHPHSKLKWVFYGASAAAIGSMAYMRLEAGKHFPSDILLGIAVGSAAGLLTPEIHKRMMHSKGRWDLHPEASFNGLGLNFNYHFGSKLTQHPQVASEMPRIP